MHIQSGSTRIDPSHLSLPDRWILSRLRRVTASTIQSLNSYRFNDAAGDLYQFVWHEFCDWYLEVKKLRFTERSGPTNDWRNVLYVFEASLRLLHPLMPFLTEELWQRLDGASPRPKSLALAAYPQPDVSHTDEEAERDMALLQEIVTSARNLRAEMKADPKQQIQGMLYSQTGALELARAQAGVIQKLAGLKLEIAAGTAPRGEGVLRSTPEYDLVLRSPAALADAQRARLRKEIGQLGKVIANSRRQLEDPEFVSRAPAHVTESIRRKLAEYEGQLAKSHAALEGLPPA